MQVDVCCFKLAKYFNALQGPSGEGAVLCSPLFFEALLAKLIDRVVQVWKSEAPVDVRGPSLVDTFLNSDWGRSSALSRLKSGVSILLANESNLETRKLEAYATLVTRKLEAYATLEIRKSNLDDVLGWP